MTAKRKATTSSFRRKGFNMDPVVINDPTEEVELDAEEEDTEEEDAGEDNDEDRLLVNNEDNQPPRTLSTSSNATPPFGPLTAGQSTRHTSSPPWSINSTDTATGSNVHTYVAPDGTLATATNDQPPRNSRIWSDVVPPHGPSTAGPSTLQMSSPPWSINSTDTVTGSYVQTYVAPDGTLPTTTGWDAFMAHPNCILNARDGVNDRAWHTTDSDAVKDFCFYYQNMEQIWVAEKADVLIPAILRNPTLDRPILGQYNTTKPEYKLLVDLAPNVIAAINLVCRQGPHGTQDGLNGIPGASWFVSAKPTTIQGVTQEYVDNAADRPFPNLFNAERCTVDGPFPILQHQDFIQGCHIIIGVNLSTYEYTIKNKLVVGYRWDMNMIFRTSAPPPRVARSASAMLSSPRKAQKWQNLSSAKADHLSTPNLDNGVAS